MAMLIGFCSYTDKFNKVHKFTGMYSVMLLVVWVVIDSIIYQYSYSLPHLTVSLIWGNRNRITECGNSG